VSRAGNLPELAAKLGIDRDELENTVRCFNGFVEIGADGDFHRGENQWKLASAKAAPGTNGRLGTIAEPPFYGVELRPAGGSSVGVLTDARGRVINQRRHLIPASMPRAMSPPPPSMASATRPACRSLRQ
jgi:3-oxosteroid 1-dehydrogenase